MDTPPVEVSVVIPVYNEAPNIPALVERLLPALDAVGRPCEVLFVDDGSQDASLALLRAASARDARVTVLELSRNSGQHAAVLAGFAASRGAIVVTLDADLQNPPEDIGSLVAEIRAGHDYVGSIRRKRRDALWRHVASRAMNGLRERITRIHMSDQGCMFRAYHRSIVDAINSCQEVSTFIPALAYSFAQNPAEVVVGHEERAAGESKYSLYSLIRLNFDLMTGFSLKPLQFVSLLGIALSLLSGLFVVFLAIRRLIVGPEAEGLFTLFGITFFLLSIMLFSVGLLGEYIGRIYVQVRHRPRYTIAAILERRDEPS